MTPKQERFVQEYLVDLNATQAAKRAGYSADTAHVIGHENLSKPEIADALAKAMAERAQETGITARWVLDQAADVYRAARDADKLSEALKALDLCGKHVDVAAFKERVDHTSSDGSMTPKGLDVSKLSDAALAEVLGAYGATNPG